MTAIVKARQVTNYMECQRFAEQASYSTINVHSFGGIMFTYSGFVTVSISSITTLNCNPF